jgi:phosphocarrier protein
MGMLMLSAGCGSTLKITAKGPDSDQVLKAIGELIDRKFDEE